MSTTDRRKTALHIRRLDDDTAQVIRVMASRFRVTQAQVVEQAMYWFEGELGNSVPLPTGWTKPRDF